MKHILEYSLKETHHTRVRLSMNRVVVSTGSFSAQTRYLLVIHGHLNVGNSLAYLSKAKGEALNGLQSM